MCLFCFYLVMNFENIDFFWSTGKIILKKYLNKKWGNEGYINIFF